MSRHYPSRIVSVASLLILYGASAAQAQTAGAASSFAIVGGTAVSANGAGSIIAGDVGVSPGTSISGFPAGATTVPPYSTHSSDGAAINAQAATLALYNDLVAAGPATAIGAQLDTQILIPGIYSIGAADLAGSGTLTLNGNGRYIFKVTSSLVANVGSQVVLLGGVDPCNVYWQVTSAATLNGVNFVGNVVAQAGITLGVGDTLVGRAFTTSLGSVTLSGNNRAGGCSTPAVAPTPTPTPAPAPVPPPLCSATAPDLFIVKQHADAFIVGVNAAYMIGLFNYGKASSTAITITDALPAALKFVSATGVGWTCGATGQVVTCTTTAVAAAASPHPNSITLTVNPGAAAVPVVTNIATVSGGADCDLTNNRSADITAVAPAIPVPTLSEWAFVMLAMLLATSGVVALGKRRSV